MAYCKAKQKALKCARSNQSLLIFQCICLRNYDHFFCWHSHLLYSHGALEMLFPIENNDTSDYKLNDDWEMLNGCLKIDRQLIPTLLKE